MTQTLVRGSIDHVDQDAAALLVPVGAATTPGRNRPPSPADDLAGVLRSDDELQDERAVVLLEALDLDGIGLVAQRPAR